MKKIINLLFLGVISLTTTIFLSCGSSSKNACKVNTSYEPLSRQATFVESTTTGETMVRATGKGCSFEQATIDAKKTAIWYILYVGDRPLLKTLEQKKKAKQVVKEILSNPDIYIRWQSDVKSKRKEGNYLLLTYLFRIDINALKEKLEESGTIKSTEEVAEKIGLPTIAVLGKKSDDLTSTAITVIQEYLQDRDFEVFVNEQTTKLNNIIKKVAIIEGNISPLYQTALQLGTDIYLSVEASVNSEYKYGSKYYKASVRAKAYETATGKMLASSVGYSPSRQVSSPEAVVQEATNDVADKITSQIIKAWIKEIKRGKPFKVVVFTQEKYLEKVDGILYRTLKKLSKRPVKKIAAKDGTLSYIAYLKGFDNSYELYSKLKEMYNGPGTVSKVMDVGSLLIIKISDKESDIIIE